MTVILAQLWMEPVDVDVDGNDDDDDDDDDDDGDGDVVERFGRLELAERQIEGIESCRQQKTRKCKDVRCRTYKRSHSIAFLTALYHHFLPLDEKETA